MRLALIVGSAWGVFCGIANGWPLATTLVQMAVPLVWVAVAVSYRTANDGRQGALLGTIALLAANISYFVIGSIARLLDGGSAATDARFFALWAALGLVVGPVSGLIGWFLREGRLAFASIVALSVVTLAEPIALWPHIAQTDSRIVFVAVGLAGFLLPLVSQREQWREATKALLVALALTYPAALALEAVLIALGQISPPLRLI